jgi:glycerophosphoryl diester phosphodiesterase
MIDRRRFGLMTAALAAGAGGHSAQARPRRRPLIIAHRGASGDRPEHTPMAYRLAVAQGADFIEPDLVLSRDGHFVCRHENEISETTDVAAHPEFAARRTTKAIDGETLTGWFTEDFTLAELKTLRCRERLPQIRPANTAYDGHDAIPTFEEVVALARAESRRTGRTIGIYPEMKHPRHFASLGLSMEPRLADRLKAHGLAGADAPVFVQCFEVGPLKSIRQLVETPLVQLISDEGGPADLPTVRYADMAGPSGLKAISAYAQGIGPEKGLVVPSDGKSLLPPTGLVPMAHALGLKVHPWTVRKENYFLPAGLRSVLEAEQGSDGSEWPRMPGSVHQLFKALLQAGVDGLFTDDPGLGVKARDLWMAEA